MAGPIGTKFGTRAGSSGTDQLKHNLLFSHLTPKEGIFMVLGGPLF